MVPQKALKEERKKRAKTFQDYRKSRQLVYAQDNEGRKCIGYLLIFENEPSFLGITENGNNGNGKMPVLFKNPAAVTPVEDGNLDAFNNKEIFQRIKAVVSAHEEERVNSSGFVLKAVQ